LNIVHKLYWYGVYMSSYIYNRIVGFQSGLRSLGLTGAFVRNPDNLFYLSGHLIGDGNESCCLFIPVQGDCLFSVPEGELSLSSIKGLAETGFPGKVVPYKQEPGPGNESSPEILALMQEKRNAVKLPIGIEAEYFCIRDADMIGIHAGRDWADIFHILSGLRKVKDGDEIQRIRIAARIADTGQDAARRYFKKDIDEITLQALSRSTMESAAGMPIECKADVLFGRNTMRIGGPFGRAGRNRAQKGDAAIVDLLPRVAGYYADTTRTLGVGELSPEKKKIIRFLEAVKQELERMVRPGVRAAEIDARAREKLGKMGSFPHHTGHGIGISSFEAPFITPFSDDVLQESMIITLEPGLYFDTWGARIEDDYLITSEGCRVLTGRAEVGENGGV